MKFAIVLAALLPLAAAASLVPDPAIECGACAEWNAPQAPFRIHGNAFYVGPRGLSAVLLVTDDGLVLFDGALPQSAPAIAASIAALGHRLEDLRWILLSHAHHDHAGGIAALQRASGAQVGASPLAAAALRAGNVPADDPQAGFGAAAMAFPAVAEVVEIADGQLLTVGEVTITALHTPGHTPGGSSWYWPSCVDGRCATFLYADSLTAVAAEGFRFTDEPARVAAFERSIARVAALECSVLVSTHPGISGLLEREAAGGGDDRHVDPAACRRYADRGAEALRARLQRERDALASTAAAR
jgi:metallo-beta-lactamase class B